ncbi:MAG: nuclear transport factor 2 family protein [Chitinophagaceae bacterium]|jgi:hypothetical protein|nr:nuclear transport factor 2 family protein [Chitinophagaceae bacterium]OQY96279.1 MAG: hypothetical protein B6D37_01970 [Sphingobacteriales bacterium UTBCD1]
MNEPSRFLLLLALVSTYSLFSCNSDQSRKLSQTLGNDRYKVQINATLDSFNQAAARADYNAYFNFYTEDAIFTGTDATERWNKKEFMDWAKPIFDKGKAWNFTTLGRHIYFDNTGTIAWFDELLNTQMKICRGSGVLVKQGNEWKLKQYILSTTVPNELLDTVIKLKAPKEDSLIQRIK